MVDKTRRKPRKQAAKDWRDNPNLYIDLRLRFPTFVVYVLEHRAKARHQTIVEVIEALLWDDVYLDEAQAVARQNTYAGRAFTEWFQIAVRRRK